VAKCPFQESQRTSKAITRSIQHDDAKLTNIVTSRAPEWLFRKAKVLPSPMGGEVSR